jgi:hypothetical protein
MPRPTSPCNQCSLASPRPRLRLACLSRLPAHCATRACALRLQLCDHSSSSPPLIPASPHPCPSSAQVKPIIKSFCSESSLTGTFCPYPPLPPSLALSLYSLPPTLPSPPTSPPPPLPLPSSPCHPLSRLRAAIRRNQCIYSFITKIAENDLLYPASNQKAERADGQRASGRCSGAGRCKD